MNLLTLDSSVLEILWDDLFNLKYHIKVTLTKAFLWIWDKSWDHASVYFIVIPLNHYMLTNNRICHYLKRTLLAENWSRFERFLDLKKQSWIFKKLEESLPISCTMDCGRCTLYIVFFFKKIQLSIFSIKTTHFIGN